MQLKILYALIKWLISNTICENIFQEEFNDDETRDNAWEMSQEEHDSVLYDLYEKQLEDIQDIEEENIELSDKWTILDMEDDDDNNSSRYND